MTELLIENGADINHKGYDGTALIKLAKTSKQNKMSLDFVDFY